MEEQEKKWQRSICNEEGDHTPICPCHMFSMAAISRLFGVFQKPWTLQKPVKRTNVGIYAFTLMHWHSRRCTWHPRGVIITKGCTNDFIKRRDAILCVAFSAVWSAVARLTVCSLAVRWGLCTFILMDALCFISSLLWDTGGHAERLDSSLAAGGVSPASSRTFQSTRCLLRFLVRTGGRKPLWNTGGGSIFSRRDSLENKRRPMTVLVRLLTSPKGGPTRGNSFNVGCMAWVKLYLDHSVCCRGDVNICAVCCLHKIWRVNDFEFENESLHENQTITTFTEKWLGVTFDLLSEQ